MLGQYSQELSYVWLTCFCLYLQQTIGIKYNVLLVPCVISEDWTSGGFFSMSVLYSSVPKKITSLQALSSPFTCKRKLEVFCCSLVNSSLVMGQGYLWILQVWPKSLAGPKHLDFGSPSSSKIASHLLVSAKLCFVSMEDFEKERISSLSCIGKKILDPQGHKAYVHFISQK